VDTPICWRNDIIDSPGGSDVEVVIANGPGYTVSPTAGRIKFSIGDLDNCAAPGDNDPFNTNPTGVVWKESGCRCAKQSTHDSVRRLASPMPLEGQSEAVWQQTLRNLAAHFSDPRVTLFCRGHDNVYRTIQFQAPDRLRSGQWVDPRVNTADSPVTKDKHPAECWGVWRECANAFRWASAGRMGRDQRCRVIRSTQSFIYRPSPMPTNPVCALCAN